jgi:hypothetical protein
MTLVLALNSSHLSRRDGGFVLVGGVGFSGAEAEADCTGTDSVPTKRLIRTSLCDTPGFFRYNRAGREVIEARCARSMSDMNVIAIAMLLHSPSRYFEISNPYHDTIVAVQ